MPFSIFHREFELFHLREIDETSILANLAQSLIQLLNGFTPGGWHGA
jgi:hypothetical protein